MQSNDLDNRIPGIDSDNSVLGTKHRTPAERQFEKRFGDMNLGYRWLKVNQYMHMYISVWVLDPAIVIGGGPDSEVLAYVMQLPSGKYRALRSAVHGNIVMPIPYGTAEEMITAVEAYILAERQEN